VADGVGAAGECPTRPDLVAIATDSPTADIDATPLRWRQERAIATGIAMESAAGAASLQTGDPGEGPYGW
jgi:hypothetical protein